MYSLEFTVGNLLVIDRERQEELMDLFKRMSEHPTDAELILLHHTTKCSLAEGETLLSMIRDAFSGASSGFSTDIIPSMLIRQAQLPSDISYDSKLIEYLESEYPFLHQ